MHRCLAGTVGDRQPEEETLGDAAVEPPLVPPAT
jgi:hypothetical protein